jgi:hypothetical protein
MQTMRVLPLVALSFAIISPAFAGDIRTINNRKVDLQPIYDWKTGGQSGERPLKHWQEVRVLEITQAISPTMHVVNAEIGGIKKEIVLRNMPKDLASQVSRLAALKSELAGADRATAAAGAAAAAAKLRASGGNVYVTGDTDYINAVRLEEERKKEEAAGAEARSVMAAANLKALKEQIASLDDQLRKNPVLAMALGTSYGGKPEWDTGLK